MIFDSKSTFFSACDIIKGTSTSCRPNVAVHPASRCIGYIGKGEINFLDLQDMHKLTKGKGEIGSNFRAMDIAPNGYHVAVLARLNHAHFKLSVLDGSNSLLRISSSALCHELEPDFRGTRRYVEQVAVKFSPDSSLIAVASSFGLIFVVRRYTAEMHCNIIPGVFERQIIQLSNERCFDFDPRSAHKYLAMADRQQQVHIIDLDEQKSVETIETEGGTDCIRYNIRGDILAVATREAHVNMYDTATWGILYSLDASCSSLENYMVPEGDKFPSIIKLSFSYNGDLMAMTSTDGYVRVWQLHQTLSLKHLSKLAVLKSTRRSDIPRLPLPPPVLLDIVDPPV